MATTPSSDDTKSGSSSHESTQSGQSTAREAARKTAEQTARMTGAASQANEQAMRATSDMMRRSAETAQNAFQSGVSMATRITERSADNLGRAMGFSGDEAQKAVQKSCGNLEAIVQSSSALAEVSQRLTGDWVNFVRERLDRNMDRFEALFRCRTPQELAAFQSEILRDNLEGLLSYSRRAAEQSMRIAEEMTKKLGEGGDGARRAA